MTVFVELHADMANILAEKYAQLNNLENMLTSNNMTLLPYTQSALHASPTAPTWGIPQPGAAPTKEGLV